MSELVDNFADRLLSAIEAKGAPVCVGIDPRYDRLPPAVTAASDDELSALRTFCMEVLEQVAPVVPAVKPQSAYFEAYGAPGVALLADVIVRARQLGLIVIADVKRNDIGSTAQAYAAGHLAGADAADAVTVNAYLGSDGVAPFAEAAAANGRGLFVLVRTSNPSAAEFQDLADVDGTKTYEHLARRVDQWGQADGLIGQCGFSSMGAVVGATWPDEARALRKLMPRQLFLVPGYGAQGASADDCLASFDSTGRGAIVNASRSVIYAHAADAHAGKDWTQAVADAARAFAEDIRQAVDRARGSSAGDAPPH